MILKLTIEAYSLFYLHIYNNKQCVCVCVYMDRYITPVIRIQAQLFSIDSFAISINSQVKVFHILLCVHFLLTTFKILTPEANRVM